MFTNFIQNAYPLFIEEDFELLVDNQEHNIFSKDTDVVRFIKRYNSMLYIVNLWNMDNIDLNLFTYRNNLYELKLTQNFQKLDCSHLFVLNLLITGYNLEYNDQSEFYPEKEIYTTTWIVNTSSKQINITKEEFNEILNVKQIIENTFNMIDINLEKDENLLKYQDKFEKKLNLQIKSKNIFLTYGIIILNSIIWILMEKKGSSQDINTLILFGANEPFLIIKGHQYWRLITSMFLHIGINHLLYNNFALYVFGSKIERYFGKIKYIVIYLISGIIGSLASIFFSFSVSAGASGGIYGLLGALLVLACKTKKQIDGLNFYNITIMILIGIGFGFTVPSVDNAAHLAGLIAGFIIGNILYKYNK
ncbi:rhomboid family intramembrane serine protease [Defluviitalea phaphyphila]|uniref:rhomboid family intramembrane serine protease n=1 Tax=Defluviitalea phaphyphila TaxID=1473580 RepID=UPI000731174E|nr:rhomboid family intramembrane serine protease [Defluviitalea phaphyphila]